MASWGNFKKALQNGDLVAIRELIAAGVDRQYVEDKGYDALIYAACGGNALGGRNLIGILKLLLEHGVRLSGISDYGESGLRILSRIGRFDGVKLLLNAGSDETQLSWTPLIREVAIGSKESVAEVLKTEPNLEQADFWSRTAWLVAILRGDIEIASVIRDAGANLDACGRCSQPPVFYAIQGNHSEMLQWLISLGQSIEQRDGFGSTTVIQAVELGSLDCLRVLIAEGTEVNVDNNGTALSRALSTEIIAALLAAGANPADISYEGIRALIHLDEYDSERSDRILHDVSKADHALFRTRTFGKANPERMTNPFWTVMIQSGASGYEAGEKFRNSGGAVGPNWSAHRFGQSFTILDDGRVILIGGEHEDSYDPDFCIYNDVFVINPNGEIEIFGYPEAVLPPTDFHTATLVGDQVLIVGSLGYPDRRQYGFTPVYRLTTNDFKIDKIETFGEMPGWIYGHRAVLTETLCLRIDGGVIVKKNGNSESYDENVDVFELDLDTRRWSKL